MSASDGSQTTCSESEIGDATGPIRVPPVESHRGSQSPATAARVRPPQSPTTKPLTLVGAHLQGRDGESVHNVPPIDSLSAQRRAEILPTPRQPSAIGWRKWLYRSSLGAINTGESRIEAERRNLLATAKRPWRRIHSLVVLGGKGGVGKTIVTAAVGSMLAELRRKDMVLATDADPGQSANLAAWIDPSASSTFADVLAEGEPERKFDLRCFVGQNAESGLDVLAANAYSGRPRGEINSEVYTQAHHRLQRLYSLLLTDTGVDYWHPVMPGVLRCSNGVLLVASAVPGGAEGAMRAIDWLVAEGYEHLVTRMVLVINHVRGFDSRQDRRSSERLVAGMAEQFNRWLSPDRIVALPYDPHIAAGGPLDLSQLRPPTWHALLKATAAVSFGLATGWSGAVGR